MDRVVILVDSWTNIFRNSPAVYNHRLGDVTKINDFAKLRSTHQSRCCGTLGLTPTPTSAWRWSKVMGLSGCVKLPAGRTRQEHPALIMGQTLVFVMLKQRASALVKISAEALAGASRSRPGLRIHSNDLSCPRGTGIWHIRWQRHLPIDAERANGREMVGPDRPPTRRRMPTAWRGLPGTAGFTRNCSNMRGFTRKVCQLAIEKKASVPEQYPRLGNMGPC